MIIRPLNISARPPTGVWSTTAAYFTVIESRYLDKFSTTTTYDSLFNGLKDGLYWLNFTCFSIFSRAIPKLGI